MGVKTICEGELLVVMVAPGQLAGDAKLAGAVIVTPAGKESEKPTPLSDADASLFGLFRAKLSIGVSPTLTIAGENDLVSLGGATTITMA